VVDTILAEKEGNGILLDVFGAFHLGNMYEMSNWGAVNGMNRESKVYECEEQDEANEEVFYKRQLVITPSTLLLLQLSKSAKNVG